MQPSALSCEATGLLVRAMLGKEASADLCDSCHSATAGNPFLLRCLLVELRDRGGLLLCLLRDLLGDAPVLVFVALVLPLIDAVELQVLGIPPGTQYVMPQLVPVTTSGSGDHACTGVEVTPDGGVGDALALIGLLVFIVLGVNLVVLEEGAEGIGNRVHRHDDLWLGLSIEPGDECEVASGGVTRDGEAGGIDGARAFQLLDESL